VVFCALYSLFSFYRAAVMFSVTWASAILFSYRSNLR